MNGRRSNIELLRIVAMMMILTVHIDGASLGLPEPYKSWSLYDWTRTIFESWAIVGVNLFVLISGYFGINLTRRRLINYVLICAFYSIALFIGAVAAGMPFTFEKALNAVLVFSRTDLWFIRDYLFLMLLAPLLNGGLKILDGKGLNLLLVAVVIINCYFGWMLDCSVNPTGYNLMQMIFMYVAGWWIARRSISTRTALAVYLLATIAIVVSAMYMPYVKAYAYNSPAVVLAAVALFVLFTKLDFSSKWINAVAVHTLAVYIIHKNPYVWGGFMRPTVCRLATQFNGITLLALYVVLALAIFFGCIIIDRLRAFLFTTLTPRPKQKELIDGQH